MKGRILSLFSSKNSVSKKHGSPETAELHEDSAANEKDASCTEVHEEADTPSCDAAVRDRRHALSIMAKHTYVESREQELICDIAHESNHRLVLRGVAMKVLKGDFAIYPRDDSGLSTWVTALCVLNVGAAMTLATTISEGVVHMVPSQAKEIAINASLRIQVCQDVADLAWARKAQGAAFVRSEKSVIVWCDEPFDLIGHARRVHDLLTEFMWQVAAKDAVSYTTRFRLAADELGGRGSIRPSFPISPASSGHLTSFSSSNGSGSESVKSLERSSSMHMNQNEMVGRLVLDELPYEHGVADPEKEGAAGTEPERPTILLAAIIHGLAFALALLVSLLQARQALRWCLLDGDWIRMAVAVASPFLFFVIMFFCDNIFGVLLMLFGPVDQLHKNSRYYSGKKPSRRIIPPALPHITVQMPVYKETFISVLKPSFESIKKAIRTYELQGGSASIIVSEDGMNLVSEEEQEARMQYYDENNITWVARPKHGKDGFLRAGRFKKASNLNFTYDVLAKAEEMMHAEQTAAIVAAGETHIACKTYDECLADVLKAIHPDARGYGKDQMGDYLLLVDSDTRIPEDCFLDAALEMRQCPDVGILQHCSGVMYVSTSFFERCIGYFTKIVNFSISFVVSNGDMAPFMGHNAYLRWSAMKEVAREEVEEASGQSFLKIWSESHVSEDFVMALDMIQHGYTVRWATYSDSQYLEGVSLSCDDELNRWQKYAWGVSEMIFNPFKQWWYRGPITPLYRRFLSSNTPVHYKWASCSYCFSYYSIALALPMSLGMALLQGWLGPDANAPYLPSFQVLVACIFVFLIGGTTALCVVRFRAGYGSIFRLLGENVKYMPFFTIFFGGLPYHISTALMSHLLGINMVWGATLKDIEMTNFFVEGPLILRRHCRLFLLCVLVLGGMSVLATDLLPLQWRVQGFYTVFPCFLCYSLHVLYPILLNPSLLRFSF